MQRENLTILVQKKEDASDRLFVFFPMEPKVGVTQIRTYTDRMKNDLTARAIMVVKENVTPFAKNALTEMSSDGKYKVELFNEGELLVDITEHDLVPKHELLSEVDKQTLLARYKLKATQLPRIQVNDPVARYHGLSRGDVVKIIRPSETAGRYITYRYVM